MIEKFYFYISAKTNPYHNLAVETALLEGLEDNALILYLWQNDCSVVIGKNQNPWAECRVREIIADGAFIARRRTGGGAVFHDLGNLNFTFISGREDLSIERNMEVIKSALLKEGISSSLSGRNDLLVDGKKVSGSAYYYGGGKAYHHGTLLVLTDSHKMEHYLTPSYEKLSSKGVKSVSSRVMNLWEVNSGVTPKSLSERIIAAAEEIFSLKAEKIKAPLEGRVKELEAKYSNWEFVFGETAEFSVSVSGRFSWGNAEVLLKVEKGVITGARVFSDALDTELPESIETKLVGVNYEKEALERVLISEKEREVLSLFN